MKRIYITFLLNMSINFGVHAETIIINERPSSCNPRLKSPKTVLKKMYFPDSGEDEDVHVIANNYLEFKRIKSAKFWRRPKLMWRDVRSSRIRGDFNIREVLQIPQLTFPRSGENFSWRGRQASCKIADSEILFDKLKKIRDARSNEDFSKLLKKERKLQLFKEKVESDGNKHCIFIRTASAKLPSQEISTAPQLDVLTSKSLKEKRDSVSSGAQYHWRTHRDTITGADIPHTTTGYDRKCAAFKNNDGGSKNNDNIDLYIELASQWYAEGFQSHFKYLDECNRNSHILKKCFDTRKRASVISGKHRRGVGDGLLQASPTSSKVSPFYSHIDPGNWRSDNISDSKPNNSMILNIRVNITNESDNNFLQNNKSSFLCGQTLNSKSNIYDIMTTSNNLYPNNIASSDINDLVNNINHLNLLDDATTSNLPKIVLTDCSTSTSLSPNPECEPIGQDDNSRNKNEQSIKVTSKDSLNIANSDENFSFEKLPPKFN